MKDEKMKNFNFGGVHWEIRVLRGGLSKKWGLGEFADLRGGAWQERGGGVFERGEVDTPMHTMVSVVE